MKFNIEKYHLKSVSFLDFLSQEDATLFRKHIVRKECKKGEFLFKEGSVSRGIYIIRKGKVKLFQTNGEGKQNIVYFYRKGDFFGHRPILAQEPHPGSAVAIDHVIVSFVSKDVFLKILSQSSTLAKALLTNLSREFSVWMNMTTLFANYGVKQRVALSLLILHSVYARGEGSTQKSIISINRDDFASYVGTAKETLVRMLRYFKDERIIASERTNIRVLKPDVLVNMVEDM